MLAHPQPPLEGVHHRLDGLCRHDPTHAGPFCLQTTYFGSFVKLKRRKKHEQVGNLQVRQTHFTDRLPASTMADCRYCSCVHTVLLRSPLISPPNKVAACVCGPVRFLFIDVAASPAIQTGLMFCFFTPISSRWRSSGPIRALWAGSGTAMSSSYTASYKPDYLRGK